MTDSSPLDAWRVAGLRQGATDADGPGDRRRELEALFRSHYAKMAGYFVRNVGSAELAGDLAQETFARALAALHKFDSRSQLSTWVWAIARNVLVAHWRRTGTEQSLTDEVGVDPDSLIHADSLADVGEHVAVRRAFRAFAQAHPDRAQVIQLAIIEEWTREELGAFLGRTPHAATQYLSQCIARLRKFMQDGERD